MALKLLSGDRRTTEYKSWNAWLKAASKLVAQFDEDLEDDPFAYNETASVSLLAAAAAKAGYLGIAEFSTVKGHKADRRRAANGRCDFWMTDVDRSWGFEFKQLRPDYASDALWLTGMDGARACARRLRSSAADLRVAGLIVSLYWQEGAVLQQSRENLRRLARECDYAWELPASGEHTGDTFFFFEPIRR
ncbi:hypothetical protein CFHF_22510 [Caulobacter flavus]|uniref:Restriction endonuclease type IV Mrr domain-containing protein n=1 Tax=Caulobacter flavus TaxID=1679497 RepID=A0A2N5CMP8_9CAUL|nr:hypothetical protein [Caulobacter flavus]AYV47074.1 hypothetical protein C1707_12840 [Caulobacter flavus]PLR07408.1 hypothetical protein CFHF_22510 [Caulobacter flavus]